MGSPTGQSSAPWTAHTGGLPQQGSASSLSAAAEGAAWGAYQGTEAALRAQMALGMLPPTATNGLDAASLNAVAQVCCCAVLRCPTCPPTSTIEQVWFSGFECAWRQAKEPARRTAATVVRMVCCLADDLCLCWQRLAAGGGYTPRSGGLSGDAQAILQQHAALGLNPRQSAALLAQVCGKALSCSMAPDAS